jgi:hypothetical protein
MVKDVAYFTISYSGVSHEIKLAILDLLYEVNLN